MAQQKYTTAATVAIIIIVIVITAISRRIQKIQNEKIKSRTRNKRFFFTFFYIISFILFLCPLKLETIEFSIVCQLATKLQKSERERKSECTTGMNTKK